MNRSTICSISLALLFSLISVHAQVTNLTVNGNSVSFTMVSGDAVSWEYDIPSGQTALGEIWIDLNDNGTIDAGSDKALFLFTQTDGDTSNNGGPPDMDGLVNGHITFSVPVGLAPKKYILKFEHNNAGLSVRGTVSPLASPNGTISGTVTPPPGKDKQNILVEASQRRDTTNQGGDGGDIFWDALTDVNGFYTIQLHTDTSTTYWRVSVQDNFAPSIATPTDVILTLTTSVSGVDFGYLDAAAQVTGRVFNESHLPMPNTDVYIGSFPGNIYRYTRSDASGAFVIGLGSGDLVGQSWILQSSQNGNYTSTILQARIGIPVINSGDSLYRELTVYTVNSQIEGYVRVNGVAPGYPMSIVAISQDTAQASTASDSVTGRFIIPVSDKLSNYEISTWSMPFNGTVTPLSAQAGDTGKILNIITTSVIERGGGQPTAFALRQNFPNPFNPATIIQYDLPIASHVTLTIYDVLGRDVAKLMDGEQRAGSYTARFDASRLPSGVYFYRLTSGNYVSTQKMILMK